MSELAQTVAAVFRRQGTGEMAATAFKHALSLDLRWFTPAEARKLLHHAADVGVVTVDGDRVRPAFDPASVDVPVTFRPTPGALEDRSGVPASADAPADAPAEVPAPAAAAPAEDGGGDARTLVGRALAEAAVASGGDPDDLRRAFRDACARHRGVFTEDVVALIVARRHGADVAALAAEAAARPRDAAEG